LNLKHTVDVVSLIRSSICDFRLVNSSENYTSWCSKYQYKFHELAKEHVYEVNDYLGLSLRKLSDKFKQCTDEMILAYKNLAKLDHKMNKLNIIKQLYLPKCYSIEKYSFFNNKEWSTVSKAFEKSNNIAFTLCLISIQGVHMI